MKIYLNKKDRIIQRQEYMIEKLKEENECLKEQIALCDTESVSEKIDLAKKSYEQYMGLIRELEDLKCEYVDLIVEVKKDKMRGLRWRRLNG